MAEKGTGKDAEQFVHKDYHDPPPSPLIDASEFGRWSFYRAIIAEFVATLLFLYITVATVIGTSRSTSAEAPCGGVGILGIAWAFGGMIFVLVYCTAGISGSFYSLSHPRLHSVPSHTSSARPLSPLSRLNVIAIT